MTSNNIYTILSSKPHNEHYLKRYWKFIQGCQYSNNGLNSYTENHHICPKSSDLFPEYNSFIDHPWNRVSLSDRQHFIAHWMLWKAYGGRQTFAFISMCHNMNPKQMSRDKKIINSKTYAVLKTDSRNLMSISKRGRASYKDAKGNTITCSTSDPRVISGELISTTLGRKCKPRTNESRLKTKEALKSYFAANINESRTRNIYFLELRITIPFHSNLVVYYLDQGWSLRETPEHRSFVTISYNISRGKLNKSTKDKIGIANKGKTKNSIWATDGVVEIKLPQSTPIPDGFIRGRLKKSKNVNPHTLTSQQ